MSDRENLLARVKAATGPDREIDRALFDALCGGIYDEATVGRFFIRIRWDAEPIAFTDSVDAALALLDRVFSGEQDKPLLYHRGSSWSANAIPQCMAVIDVAFGEGGGMQLLRFDAQAPTEPLAILTALLSALQSQAGK